MERIARENGWRLVVDILQIPGTRDEAISMPEPFAFVMSREGGMAHTSVPPTFAQKARKDGAPMLKRLKQNSLCGRKIPSAAEAAIAIAAGAARLKPRPFKSGMDRIFQRPFKTGMGVNFSAL